MSTHEHNGLSFTPYSAIVIASRRVRESGESETTYANGIFVVEEDGSHETCRVVLWLSQVLTGFNTKVMIDLPSGGRKLTADVNEGKAWAPCVDQFEEQIRDELGSDWKIEIRLGTWPESCTKIGVR